MKKVNPRVQAIARYRGLVKQLQWTLRYTDIYGCFTPEDLEFWALKAITGIANGLELEGMAGRLRSYQFHAANMTAQRIENRIENEIPIQALQAMLQDPATLDEFSYDGSKAANLPRFTALLEQLLGNLAAGENLESTQDRLAAKTVWLAARSPRSAEDERELLLTAQILTNWRSLFTSPTE